MRWEVHLTAVRAASDERTRRYAIVTYVLAGHRQ
jgi:hypothetical protein